MFPSTFYRVSIKAYITDSQGRVFVVQENDNEGRHFWGLPGGGMDHGELPVDCLKREIQEELGINDVTVNEIAYTKSFYLTNRDVWLLWIVYHAQINSTNCTFDDDVTDAAYIDSESLATSTDIFEMGIVEVDRAMKTKTK